MVAVLQWVSGGVRSPEIGTRTGTRTATVLRRCDSAEVNDDIAKMLPADYWAAYENDPPPPVAFRGPLPDLITHHYTSGGCFTLAAALHLASGQPIELHYRDGLPRHAYVTDGLTALDICGPRPIRTARAGAEGFEQVTIDGLVRLLPTIPDTGRVLLADLRRPSSQVAAERVAQVLLDIAGWANAAD